MSEFSWDDTNMQLICGECHFKDENPDLCHAVEPPMKKFIIPHNLDCGFIRESQWQRVPQEQRERFKDDIKRRNEWMSSSEGVEYYRIAYELRDLLKEISKDEEFIYDIYHNALLEEERAEVINYIKTAKSNNKEITDKDVLQFAYSLKEKAGRKY